MATTELVDEKEGPLLPSALGGDISLGPRLALIFEVGGVLPLP